jgi:DeoR/GlpR family transcriptional regulator of sugar metabolism
MQLTYDAEYFISCQGQSNADTAVFIITCTDCLLILPSSTTEHYLEWMVHRELQVVRCSKRITAALLYIGAFVDLGLSLLQYVHFP